MLGFPLACHLVGRDCLFSLGWASLVVLPEALSDVLLLYHRYTIVFAPSNWARLVGEWLWSGTLCSLGDESNWKVLGTGKWVTEAGISVAEFITHRTLYAWRGRGGCGNLAVVVCPPELIIPIVWMFLRVT